MNRNSIDWLPEQLREHSHTYVPKRGKVQNHYYYKSKRYTQLQLTMIVSVLVNVARTWLGSPHGAESSIGRPSALDLSVGAFSQAVGRFRWRWVVFCR